MPGEQAQHLTVPPSRHITTAYEELVSAVAERIGEGDRAVCEEVAGLLDASVLFDFQHLRRLLKSNFKPFKDAAAGQHLRRQDPRQLKQTEAAFLDEFYALLQAAHFKVLTAAEWDAACEEDFTFNYPVEVTWAHMEPGLLQRFWARQPEQTVARAPVCDRVLVLHRGVHVARAKGMFLDTKIDFLVLFLIARPLERLFRPLLHALFKDHASRLWPSVSIVQSVKGANVAESMVGKPKQGALEEHAVAAAEDPALQHDNAKRVERVTLKGLMPDASSVLRLFFKELTIAEPTFRDVVILFRRDAHSQLAETQQTVLLRDAKAEDLAWNLNIKRFNDVPMADFEMVFPDRQVYLRPLLVVQLIATIVLGLISVFVTVLTTEASWSLIFAVLSILGTRAFQVWNSAQLGRQQVLDKITERLYEQTMDAQEGVLHFLLDQTGDQHVKELLLAYACLLHAGEPVTQHQLDRRCEQWLKQTFGEAVDFALENSLPVLLDYGVVRRDGQARLTAAPLNEARRLLLELGRAHFAEEKGERPQSLPLLAELWSSGGAKRPEASVDPGPGYEEQPVPAAAPQPTGAVERPSRKTLASA